MDSSKETINLIINIIFGVIITIIWIVAIVITKSKARNPNIKTYYPDDAIEFVYKILRPQGFTTMQIQKVLDLEFAYQKSVGLVGLSPSQANNLEDGEFDPTPYILEKSQGEFTKDQIQDILDAETEYLKHIGAVK